MGNNIAKIIQTTILIPIREDKNIGDGRLHSNKRWRTLIEVFKEKFGGWHVGADTYPGGWVNPETKETIQDESKKYFVDIKLKDLNKMRAIIRWIAKEFKQECIRFEHEGEVEYISASED